MKQTPRQDQECCNDPGAISQCWWRDAATDGVTCSNAVACSSGRSCDFTESGPSGEGLCSCTSQDDCNNGATMHGICVIPDGEAVGRCGPSFCNGYSVCSCWGGCVVDTSYGYDTPVAMCTDLEAGYPGYCCEGLYPATSGGTTYGFCTRAEFCEMYGSGGSGGIECENDSDCSDGNECTDDVCTDGTCQVGPSEDGTPCSTATVPVEKSLDCIEEVCQAGACSARANNETGDCADNVQPPAASESWHGECWRNACDDSGVCSATQYPAGQACDDENACSVESECDSDGVCNGTVADTTAAECCDPALAVSYDDGNACTTDWCPSATSAIQFHDQHADVEDDTDCANGVTYINDECGIWSCQSGVCEEQTAVLVGGDCRSGDWSACVKYTCSGAVGEEGQCVATSRNEGEECEWNNAPDTCQRKVCESGACVYELAVETSGCTPQVGPVDPCCDYECNGSNVCEEGSCSSVSSGAEECDGVDLGILETTIGDSITESATNKCASNDYGVSTTGRFSACDFADDGETVYQFTEQTHLTEYQLRRTEITVTGDGSWDPLVYTSTGCEESGAGQYTCGAGSDTLVTTSGPWPLVDTPTSGAAEGYTTTNLATTHLFVDARTTQSPSGGDYTVSLEVTAHANSSCVNSGSEVEAPYMDGGRDWRERFRGNVNGYGNYFHTVGEDLSGYCWGGGTAGADDPKFAFFRMDLPDGVEAMTSGTTSWDHTYKIYTDPAGTGRMEDVLSWWGGGQPDGDCGDALGTMTGCESTGRRPRELVVKKGTSPRSGWVGVSNKNVGESGSYELNVVRVPRRFLGMAQMFVGPGEGAGCLCGGEEVENWHQNFDLVGSRLDFTPTNNDVEGFTVRKSEPLDPRDWLVAGGDQVCSGFDCTSPADTSPYDIGFQFPYSGDVWSKFCINGAGALTLAQGDGDCVNKYDAKPNAQEFLESMAANISPMWGTLVPCSGFTESGCKRNGSWRGNGELECLAPEWTCWLGCDVWHWRGESCSNPGEIRKQLTTFEGTSALVVTWEGFDGEFNPRNGGTGYTVDFQVILRVDGRITFFYRTPQQGADEVAKILDVNGWMVGVSGGRSIGCSSDADCVAEYGTTGVVCDDEDYVVEENMAWRAYDRCMNPVDFQDAVVPVPGAWEGE